MPDCCICYCTDPGYLFPTLLSASQVRMSTDPNLADVLIVAIGFDDGLRSITTRICAREGVKLVCFDRIAIDKMPSAYARLFLDRLLPEQYNSFLYLDGDTQIRSPLDDLLRADPPSTLQAAIDPMAFLLDKPSRRGRRIRGYMSCLGLDESQSTRYFNSGVLRANRTNWASICRDALLFARTKPERCLFNDQCALNYALHGTHIPISLKWNFPIFMRNSGVEGHINPAIYHFMSNPRPWFGDYPPWNKAFSAPYPAFIQKHSELLPYIPPPLSFARMIKYTLQQRLKQFTEVATWRFGSRSSAILDYERSVLH
jgi:hypothetical protein